MDMHMPVMDGIEASVKIFELNTGIPIVAMTANIMSGDLEIYKQNGMNDCVGKPFTSQELWRCLLKYLKPLNKTVKAESSKTNRLPEKDHLLEEDEEFQKGLRKMFVNSSRNTYGEIVKALEEGDIKYAHRLAHTLKSNAGQIGKDALRKAAVIVEERLKEGENRVTEDQLKKLETELNTVLDELSFFTGETSSVEAAEPLDADAVRKLIGKLEPMLKLNNTESHALIGDVRRIPENEELVNRLIRQIEDFDFEEAVVTLDELKRKLAI